MISFVGAQQIRIDFILFIILILETCHSMTVDFSSVYKAHTLQK